MIPRSSIESRCHPPEHRRTHQTPRSGLTGLLLLLLLLANPVGAAAVPASGQEQTERGILLYETGQYNEAIRSFTEAYRQLRRPKLLFNIAQAHRMAGRAAEAVVAYQRFLREDPDSPRRAEAEARIRELQAAMEKHRTPEPGGAQATREPPPPLNDAHPVLHPALQPITQEHVHPSHTPGRQAVHRRWWFWTALGISVAGATAGLVGGLLASRSASGQGLPPNIDILDLRL